MVRLADRLLTARGLCRYHDADIAIPDSDGMQKALIIIGLCILLLGLAWPWLGQLPFGRLPGDLVIERENFRFYLPLTTMVIVSVLVSIAFWLFR
jgi:hypothetical protein